MSQMKELLIKVIDGMKEHWALQKSENGKRRILPTLVSRFCNLFEQKTHGEFTEQEGNCCDEILDLIDFPMKEVSDMKHDVIDHLLFNSSYDGEITDRARRSMPTLDELVKKVDLLLEKLPELLKKHAEVFS